MAPWTLAVILPVNGMELGSSSSICFHRPLSDSIYANRQYISKNLQHFSELKGVFMSQNKVLNRAFKILEGL